MRRTPARFAAATSASVPAAVDEFERAGRVAAPPPESWGTQG